MGRIKLLMVKKAARQLLEIKPEVFTSSYEHNKKVLGSTMPSKPIRNKIAGYIARLIKMKSKPIKIRKVQPEEREFKPRYTKQYKNL